VSLVTVVALLSLVGCSEPAFGGVVGAEADVSFLKIFPEKNKWCFVRRGWFVQSS